MLLFGRIEAASFIGDDANDLARDVRPMSEQNLRPWAPGLGSVGLDQALQLLKVRLSH